MLGAVVFAGVALGGGPRFSGPRWVPGAGEAPPEHLSTLAPTLASQPPVETGSTSVLGPLLLTVAVVLGAAVILWFVLRAVLRTRARQRALPSLEAAEPSPPPLPADAAVTAEPDAPIVHRGLRLALELLDEQREPDDAVVRAWLGLQSAAEESGVERRPAETPTEFTARVITRVQADAAAAAQLVDVYQGVRFGGHPITPADVRRARTAVERLLDSWHEPVVGRRR